MQIQKEKEEMEREEEREHRGAIGAESKVMERTCRVTEKKMGDGKEKRYKPPKACRENKTRARESETESARIHVPVRRKKSKRAKGKWCRHKPRREHVETKRE